MNSRDKQRLTQMLGQSKMSAEEQTSMMNLMDVFHDGSMDPEPTTYRSVIDLYDDGDESHIDEFEF